MHRTNKMSKSTKRGRVLEETAVLKNILENSGLSLNDIKHNNNNNNRNSNMNVMNDVELEINNLNLSPNLFESFSHSISIKDNIQDHVNVNQQFRFYDQNTIKINLKSEQLNLSSDLSKWSIHHTIKNNAFSGLLKIIKKHDCFNNIPIDARTIFRKFSGVSYDSSTSICKTISSGLYHHFGIENDVKRYLDTNKIN